METETLIQQTVDATIKKLKHNGMLKAQNTDSYARTEDVLRRYPNLECESPLLMKIEEALDSVREDQYYDIIVFSYFDGICREEVGYLMNVTPRTVTRHKRRLVEQIRDRLFPEAYLEETFSSVD